MDLVNDYLRAVAGLLPKAQRDDIIAELRDTILTRLEEREGELGRPLSDDETEAVLREVGHPVVVAARYGEGPQHVVGPTLYPYWLFAVKAAVVLQALVAAVVLIVRTVAYGDFGQAFGQALGSAVTGTLVMIGAATVVGWMLERRGGRIGYLERWRVRDLRVLELATWDLEILRGWLEGHRAQRTARTRRPGRAPRMARAEVSPVGRGLGLIALGSVLGLWWSGVLYLGRGLEPGDLGELHLAAGAFAAFDWAAFKALIFWPVLSYFAILVLQGALMLAHPWAVRLHGAVEAGRGALVLGFCVWLWTASPIASAVAVDGVAGFAQRMAMFHDHQPVPLEPIATLAVMGLAIGGLGLLLTGLGRVITGARQDGTPVAAPVR